MIQCIPWTLRGFFELLGRIFETSFLVDIFRSTKKKSYKATGVVSIKSGQIIATSNDLTPNGGLVREIPLFQTKSRLVITKNWGKDWMTDTVDGRNPVPVEMTSIPIFTWFYTSQVVQDFFHQQYCWNKLKPPTSELVHLWAVITLVFWCVFWVFYAGCKVWNQAPFWVHGATQMKPLVRKLVGIVNGEVVLETG